MLTVSFWELALNAAAVGVSVFVILMLLQTCWQSRSWPLSKVMLLAFFTTAALDIGMTLNEDAYPEHGIASLYGLSTALYGVYPVSLWIYVRSLTSPVPRLDHLDYRHLLPIFLIALGNVPNLLLDPASRVTFWDQEPDWIDTLHVLVVAGTLLALLVWTVSLIFYMVIILKRLIRHRRTTRDLFAETQNVDLNWLNYVMGYVIIFAGLTIFDEILSSFTNKTILEDIWLGVFHVGMVASLGLFGLTQQVARPAWSKHLEEPEQQERYARSALKPDDLERIAQKLDRAMVASKLWENSGISLKTLSEATGIPPNNISQTLNERKNQNFFDYVNGMRIEAACIALKDSSDTILSISENVGFNSKSTFNSAFKRIMNTTPRDYRKRSTNSAK